MPYDYAHNTWILDDDMTRLQKEKFSAAEIQERKHNDWNENYELYRNKVRTNRLTQRQAVNIPLMKETIKTLLSKVDDPPDVSFTENTGDELKELYYQEIWNREFIENKLELVDMLDKKNVFLYGQSVKMLNIYESGVKTDVLDVFDILLDPLMSPGQIETSRFIIRQNIFRSVRDVLADDRYNNAGKEELKIWADSPPGLAMSQLNKEEWDKKMERLRAMGVNADDFHNFAAGDRLVNLTEHFTTVWNKSKKEFERRVITYAEDKIKLRDVTLEEALGVDFWPFVVWSEDPETNDIYPDSVADLVRTPNKVLNVWYSQLVENRTLKNFQMHWYNPVDGYEAKTYTPGPGVMIPAPPGEDINKNIRPVEISGLDDTFDAINAITRIVERGTGATAIDKGTAEKGQQTLGEVQILVGKSEERAISTAKYYRMAWQELAEKWDKLMHANAPKFFKLYKQAASGKIYFKKVFKNDWWSSEGYTITVRSSSEQEANDIKSFQKWQAVVALSPNNVPLREVYLNRAIDLLDVTPAEREKIQQGEQQMMEMMQRQNETQQMTEQQQPMNPEEQVLEQSINDKLQELQNV